MKKITTYEHSVLQNLPSTLEDRDDMNLCSLNYGLEQPLSCVAPNYLTPVLKGDGQLRLELIRVVWKYSQTIK